MAGVEVQRVADGLWRWTAVPARGNEVASAYLELADAVVLVDPVLPAEGDPERERFWRALDRDVERLGRPVVVAETRAGAGADAAAAIGRYPGAGRWAPGAGPLPAGLEGLPLGGDGDPEVVLWVAGHRTLIVGRALEGRSGGGLVVAAQLDPAARATLLDLPVERVLTARGAPVLVGGGVALRAALSKV